MTVPTPPLTYAPEYFVNRTAEIGFVYDKVTALLTNRLVEKRTVIFTGEHGMGKSWLLLHLHQLLHNEQQVKALHLDLATYALDSLAATVVDEILSRVGAHLIPNLALPSATLEGKSYTVIQTLKGDILPHQPLVLLVDSVYESPKPWLTLLENYLLAPLAVATNVILVIAGRGQLYPWAAPELKLRADFFQNYLPPFQSEATYAQLEHQFPAALPRHQEIHRLSQGNPKATFLLATHTDLPAAFDQILQEMLAPIPVEERQKLRAYLEALCVLRQFDHQSRMALLLRTYDTRFGQLTRRELMDISDSLLKRGLSFWDSQLSAYTFHPVTRNLALQYLRAARPVLWQKLHTTAHDLYSSWAHQYPHNQAVWQTEADYHDRQLRMSGQIDD